MVRCLIRVAAVVALLLPLGAPAWAGYEEGVAAYKRGDYATALRQFKPLAEQGLGNTNISVSETQTAAAVSASPNPSESHDDEVFHQEGATWMTVTLIAMALATVVSVAVSFYLYRWRRILLGNPHMLLPEESGVWLKRLGNDVEKMSDRLGNDVEKMSDSFNSGMGRINQLSSETGQKVSNLVETFMTLQKALDERDEEIRRLKRGYDTEIFLKFLRRFIRVDQAIDDVIRGEQVTPNSPEQIKRILDDAFAQCGVESFEPTIGENYRSAEGVADNPKHVEPKDLEDEWKIVEVLEAGRRIKTPEGYAVILPAKVSIYRTKN